MPDFAYQRLGQLDRSFLIYEGPDSPMHVAATQIYELGPLRTSAGGVDVERIQEYVLSRLHRIPRYRQRLAFTPLEGHPIWVDDVHFNIRYHVRHTRLPRPGGERLLKRVAGRILSQQLDRGKPLWEMWVIEGLGDDRFAVVTKTHHCMVDGISGVDLLSVLLRPEPGEKIEPPHTWRPRPAPSGLRLLGAEAWRRAGAPLRLGSALWRLASDEQGARGALLERARAAAAVLGSGLAGTTPTPLNQRIGPHRRIDWLPMDLRAIRGLRKRLGGSVNDVVLATVAGALRRFLGANRQTDVEHLRFRVMAPVSTRSEAERGTLGNRVSAWIVELPVGEPDPRRRLAAVCRTTAALKDRRGALATETLSRVTEWAGPTLLTLGARLVALTQPPFNMVVTNVPGPRLPLYLLGSRMLEAHPMVPLLGNLAVGIALFSYCDTLSWGISADWDRFPDLHDFVLALDGAFRELCEAAGTAS